MYDYISVRKDNHYSAIVSVTEFVGIAAAIPELRQTGAVSFGLQLEQAYVDIRGILADSHGNYCYQPDHVFTDINLIEITIPPYALAEQETRILELALIFARKLNWQIEDHETGQIWC